MLGQHPFNWHSIQIRDNGQATPKERWGHRLLKVKSELYLFGGFGGVVEGQGTYLNDLWKFNLLSATWQKVKTTGDYPQPRSNYTIHFNQVDNEIIIFGGGASRKVRYNSIFTLNLATLQWRKIIPVQNSYAPWERTYHTSEFLYPYLVVFGGQGVSYIDLNDTWVFDVRNQQWTRIFPNGKVPTKRRFANSAVIEQDFYLVGGCQGSYNLIGDIHRLSLQPLLQNRKQELKWQCLVQNNKLLQRWGHSCNSLNGNLYIFAGRVSQSIDNSDFIEYDPSTNKLEKLQTQGSVPKPRRRHATVIVNSNLLCFGGYDGTYLKDFTYMKIEKQNKKSSLTILKVKNRKELNKQLNQMQKEMNEYTDIEIEIKGRSMFVPTNPLQLKQNSFFNYLTKNHGLYAQLPIFCSQTIFRIINVAIIKRVILINEAEGLNSFSSMIESFSYFCCHQEIKELENYLIGLLSSQNALSMLQISINSQLTRLNELAAFTYLKNQSCAQKIIKNSKELSIEENLLKASNSKELYDKTLLKKMNDGLKNAYEKYAFEIEQKRLKKSKQGFKNKAKNLIKELFSFKSTSTQEIRCLQRQKQKAYRQGILSYLKGNWAF